MRKKKSYAGLIIVPLLIIVLYIIFAARRLTTEFHLTPSWTMEVQNTELSPGEEADLIPYKFKDCYGYFTADGKLVSKIDYDFKAAISTDYSTSYGMDSKAFRVYSTNQNVVCYVKEAGFPYFSQDRIYVILPGGTSIAQYDNKGEQIFLHESYSTITALASSKGGTACGYADGTVIVFDKHGVIQQNFIPGGSEENVIYGIALSEDGKTAAYITGLDKQRLVVSTVENNLPKVIYYEYFDQDLTRESLVKFNGNLIYYNYKGGLGILNLDKKKSYKYELDGIITQVEFTADNKVAFVLSKNGDKYTITMLEPYNHFAGKFSFQTETAFIQVRNNDLFVGRNDKISKLTISRK